ncbi:MAG: LysR family transcriptional regulator [Gemmatimonadaceae bacterium]|nr:LysR family transcriptional regulator [Acetobacteraceae bacterium]
MAVLSDLETFVAVAGSRSFAAAARRLALSPAMVGRRIQSLEERYGAKLIERTTRSHRLTGTGQRFLAKANEILETVEELGELARPDDVALSGRIRISGPTTFGITRLAEIIARLSETHPALAIELNLSDRNVDLVGEGFDLAVRIGELASTAMIARRVGSYFFVCCASPSYLDIQGAPKTPADLERFRCILNLNLVPRDRWPFHDESGARFTVEVRGNLEIDNGEALRTAALAGAGIIYAPHDLVSVELRDGTLVQILEGWPTMTLPIHTVHPSRRLVPRRVKALIEVIAEELRDRSG